jgi:hypothetical protein
MKNTFSFLVYRPRVFYPVMSSEMTRKEAWLLSLREDLSACQQEIVGRPCLDREPIHRVLAVGALCCDEGIDLLDYHRIKDALRGCQKQGLSIRPDFDLSVMNLNKQGEGDFLSATGEADLIITCYVYNGASGRVAESPFFEGPDDPTFNQSSLHHVAGAWHDAALRFGARAIVTCGGHTEIMPRDFSAGPGQESRYVPCRMTDGFSRLDGMKLLVRSDVKVCL